MGAQQAGTKSILLIMIYKRQSIKFQKRFKWILEWKLIQGTAELKIKLRETIATSKYVYVTLKCLDGALLLFKPNIIIDYTSVASGA